MTLVKFYDRPAFNEWLEPLFVSEQKCNERVQYRNKPATNIYEMSEAFVIEMAVPGMSKEDFSISLEKEILTLSMEKEFTSQENYLFTRKEFTLNPFKNSFAVPKSVDSENITADYFNGILKVLLPKKEESKIQLSRQINVN